MTELLLSGDNATGDAADIDSNNQDSNLRLVTGMRDIVDDYDTFVLDMWGVMHDGFTAYDGVIECVTKLRAAGKKLIILSNSSQRKEKSLANLEGLGFAPATDFEQIVTSGEVSFLTLSGDDLGGCCEPWNIVTQIRTNNQQYGKDNKVFVLGSEEARDVPYVEACGWKFSPIDEADLILACGTFAVNDGTGEINKRTDAVAYNSALQKSLQTAARRGIPMLVSNPDKVRPDYERPPMPGRLGDMYEQALIRNGRTAADAEALVKRIGKPFEDVYDIALKDTVDLSRACMVGDALETDVTGGSAAGIDTVWILEDGVYMPELDAAAASGKSLLEGATSVLNDFNDKKETSYAKGKPNQMPTVAMAHFRW